MMPLEKQMWGDEFGMCTDKFGVAWMVNIAGDSEPGLSDAPAMSSWGGAGREGRTTKGFPLSVETDVRRSWW